ncbi:unnamed protein product, partial [Scytosiphon promiscuus]
MWKPAEVLPKDKRRAVALFIALLLGILTYSGYLVAEAVKKRRNPSTSFVLSNQLYRYPDVYVCLYDYFGCDEMDLEEECVFTAFDTQGARRTRAVFNPDGDTEQEIAASGILTDSKGWCASFEASEVEIADGERDPEDYILLDMYWYPGGGANASTTCISEHGEWNAHSESVFMFLRDPDTGILSAGIQVAYSCMTSESSSHVFTFVGIGLTKEYKILGPDTASYTALTTSSAVYKDERNANITGIVSPYAWVSMEIAQSTNSLREIKEIDPLEVAEMFGNVGGFWDLLLILWPIFFVTASRQEPHLKIRNFKKSVVRGSERAVGSIGVSLPRPLRRMQGGRLNFSPVEGERVPSWDRRQAAPVRQEFPARRFSDGSISRAALSHSPPAGGTIATNTVAPLASSSARWRGFRAPASSTKPNSRVVRVNSGVYRSRSSPFRANPPRVAQDSNISNRNSRSTEPPAAVSETSLSSTAALLSVARGDGGGG